MKNRRQIAADFVDFMKIIFDKMLDKNRGIRYNLKLM